MRCPADSWSWGSVFFGDAEGKKGCRWSDFCCNKLHLENLLQNLTLNLPLARRVLNQCSHHWDLRWQRPRLVEHQPLSAWLVRMLATVLFGNSEGPFPKPGAWLVDAKRNCLI